MGEKRTIKSINPATGELLNEVEAMSKKDIRSTVSAAQEASQSWGALPVKTRCDYIKRVGEILSIDAGEIAETIHLEVGKPVTEALICEISLITDFLYYLSVKAPGILADRRVPIHLAGVMKEAKMVYQPLGVVTIISPWNFPFFLSMGNIIYPLLAGDTVLYKPSSQTTLTGKKIEQLFKKADLPEGVFNLIICPGSLAGQELVKPPVKHVVFTGSTEAGREVALRAAEHFIPVDLELGGKDAALVFDDVDIDFAASGIVYGAMLNCGQICASIERCYVQENIFDEFVDKVVNKVKALKVGTAENRKNYDIGPLVSEEQLQIVKEQVDDAIAQGAKALAGGKQIDGPGYFFQPTVLVDVKQDMRIMQDETFGPVLPIMAFHDEEEAIKLANDSRYGLTASVWTNDKRRYEEVARRLEAGGISQFDHMFTGSFIELPWQGVKESGMGYTHTLEGLRKFTFGKPLLADRQPYLGKLTRPYWYPYSSILAKSVHTGSDFLASLTKTKTRLCK
ncbi:MAG: aldehyde dehydrogenase family protein [Actinomycetota bacterium]|nr:aldehyde dehydrogenase family protein [Actinomycetota bacterium]